MCGIVFVAITYKYLFKYFFFYTEFLYHCKHMDIQKRI